jgi:hypothetical protein
MWCSLSMRRSGGGRQNSLVDDLAGDSTREVAGDPCDITRDPT